MFLSTAERRFAPTLYDALLLAEKAWDRGWTKSDSIGEAIKLIQSRIQVASESLERVDIKLDYVEMNDTETFEELGDSRTIKLDYVEMNDAETFEELGDSRTKSEEAGGQIILSGALWIGGTRMIDNILIGAFPSI